MGPVTNLADTLSYPMIIFFKSLLIKYKQFLKFILVGGMNTLCSYIIFAVLVWAGMHYTLAMFLLTFMMLIINFNTTGRLVFNNRNRSLFWKFITAYACSYLINIATIKGASLFYPNIYLNGLIAAVVTASMSYYLLKNHVFNSINKKI